MPIDADSGPGLLAIMGASKMKLLFKNFLADESGMTAIEYGLIAAGIALVIIAVVNGLWH